MLFSVILGILGVSRVDPGRCGELLMLKQTKSILVNTNIVLAGRWCDTHGSSTRDGWSAQIGVFERMTNHTVDPGLRFKCFQSLVGPYAPQFNVSKYKNESTQVMEVRHRKLFTD